MRGFEVQSRQRTAILGRTNVRRHQVGGVRASLRREAELKTLTLLGTLVFFSVGAASLQVSSPDVRSDLPQYTSADEFLRPEGYRQWIFLSSRLRVNSKAPSGERETFGDVSSHGRRIVSSWQPGVGPTRPFSCWKEECRGAKLPPGYLTIMRQT